jgi:hypothetical protein
MNDSALLLAKKQHIVDMTHQTQVAYKQEIDQRQMALELDKLKRHISDVAVVKSR